MTDLDEITAAYEALGDHAADCPVCQKRAEFLKQRFPPMDPYPMRRKTALLVGAFGWFERLPKWLQPAAAGAALLAIMTLPGAAMGALTQGPDDPSMYWIAPLATLVASGAGAVGGLVYSFLGRPLRRFGLFGDYAAGIVAVLGYMGAILVPAQLFFDEPVVGGPEGTVIFLLVSVFFGLVVGYQFRKLDA